MVRKLKRVVVPMILIGTSIVSAQPHKQAGSVYLKDRSKSASSHSALVYATTKDAKITLEYNCKRDGDIKFSRLSFADYEAPFEDTKKPKERLFANIAYKSPTMSGKFTSINVDRNRIEIDNIHFYFTLLNQKNITFDINVWGMGIAGDGVVYKKKNMHFNLDGFKDAQIKANRICHL